MKPKLVRKPRKPKVLPLTYAPLGETKLSPPDILIDCEEGEGMCVRGSDDRRLELPTPDVVVSVPPLHYGQCPDLPLIESVDAYVPATLSKPEDDYLPHVMALTQPDSPPSSNPGEINWPDVGFNPSPSTDCAPSACRSALPTPSPLPPSSPLPPHSPFPPSSPLPSQINEKPPLSMAFRSKPKTIIFTDPTPDTDTKIKLAQARVLRQLRKPKTFINTDPVTLAMRIKTHRTELKKLAADLPKLDEKLKRNFRF